MLKSVRESQKWTKKMSNFPKPRDFTENKFSKICFTPLCSDFPKKHSKIVTIKF